MAISVLIVDDHAIVRDGLRALLEARGDIAVVGTAADGREAVRQALRLRPNVVVMDLAMPELNGIDATGKIHEELPDTEVLILSMHSNVEHIFRAFQAGARGYLLKESVGQEVADAVRAVHAGIRYMSKKVSDSVVDEYLRSRRMETPLTSLSMREREILQLVAEGSSSAEIAAKLHLSPKTVDTYRSRLMQKLGIEDLPSLVKFAIQHGLTPL